MLLAASSGDPGKGADVLATETVAITPSHTDPMTTSFSRRTLMNRWRCAALKPSTSRLSAGPVIAGPETTGGGCGGPAGFAGVRLRFVFFLPSSSSCAEIATQHCQAWRPSHAQTVQAWPE